MAVVWIHQAHSLNDLIWRSFLNPRPDRNDTGSPTRRRAQMVQARQNTWKYTRMTTDNESFTNWVQNTSSRNLHKLHNLQTLHSVAKLKWKRKHTTTLLHWFSSNTTGQTGTSHRSDRCYLALPTTGQTGPLTGQTGRNKTEGCTPCPQVCNPPNP
jgi:hypothetical protein